MRKLFLLAALLPTFASAQIFSSVSTDSVAGTKPGDVRMAGISRDGRYAFVTSMSNKGLVRVSLSDGTKVTMSEQEGAGIAPAISDDGQLAIHSADTFGPDHLRRAALYVTDAATGDSRQMWQPARSIGPYRFVGHYAEAEIDGKAIRRKLASREEAADERPAVCCDGLKLRLTTNGTTVTLTPNGDDDDTNYIWASVSPDGKRILYHVSSQGTYVCDLRGEDVQYIAYDCYAPQWYDDNIIVGMKERDDDLRIASSAIVAYTLDGARQQLTSDDDVLLFPYCSSEAGRIVCARGNGEMVILNVKKQTLSEKQ